MAILETQGIVKNFGGLTAVNNVSVSIEEGEIVGLIGPNGAGKTTFLNCVAGALKPSGGRALFAGEETTGAPPEVMCNKGMSRTFQIPIPFPKLTVLENVMVGAVFGSKHLHGKTARARRGRRSSSCASHCRWTRRPNGSTQFSSSGWIWLGRWPAAPRSFCSTSSHRG